MCKGKTRYKKIIIIYFLNDHTYLHGEVCHCALQNPALTKAFTKDDARFCFAESKTAVDRFSWHGKVLVQTMCQKPKQASK